MYAFVPVKHLASQYALACRAHHFKLQLPMRYDSNALHFPTP
jgi:hypothetical protein